MTCGPAGSSTSRPMAPPSIPTSFMTFHSSGIRDGTLAPRGGDTPCNIHAGNRLSGRHMPQRPPQSLLERRAADIARQIKANPRGFHIDHHARDQGLIVGVTADEMRFWKAVPEMAHEFVRLVPEQDGNHALPARGNENGAERCPPDGKPDLLIRPAGTVA